MIEKKKVMFLWKSKKAMAPHSSTLAWKIPWTEEPGRLQSKGSLRVWDDWVISLSCIGEGNGNPLQCSCLENPRDGGACWASVYGVTQSWTRLKRLSSSKQYFSQYFSQYSNTLAKEPTHWKRPWCWERLKAKGEGGSRGWDGWMASLTQWT